MTAIRFPLAELIRWRSLLADASGSRGKSTAVPVGKGAAFDRSTPAPVPLKPNR